MTTIIVVTLLCWGILMLIAVLGRDSDGKESQREYLDALCHQQELEERKNNAKETRNN